MTAPVAPRTSGTSRDDLFETYDYLCVHAARRYRGDPIGYDDLLQIGRVGNSRGIPASASLNDLPD